MTVAELRRKLAKSGVPKDAYSLKGGLPNEALCLEHSDEEWHIYYSERGLKNRIAVFYSEHDACDYFYDLVKKSL